MSKFIYKAAALAMVLGSQFSKSVVAADIVIVGKVGDYSAAVARQTDGQVMIEVEYAPLASVAGSGYSVEAALESIGEPSVMSSGAPAPEPTSPPPPYVMS